MRVDKKELDKLVAYYDGVIGDYRRELAHMQGELDRAKSELEYARTVVDGLDTEVLRELEFWRHEAGRASAAEKEATKYADLRLATVESREREIGKALTVATEGGFQRGWAQALSELEEKLGFDKLSHIEVLRYEAVDSAFFKLHKENLRDLVERLKALGAHRAYDDTEHICGVDCDFDDI